MAEGSHFYPCGIEKKNGELCNGRMLVVKLCFVLIGCDQAF